MKKTGTPLEEWIIRCEGYKKYPYKDTVDKLTIGFGRNLEDRGISVQEGMMLLRNDLRTCIAELTRYSWYREQPPMVRDALINMCYNLGMPRLIKFKKMIYFLNKKDYTNAAKEALDSKWAAQVGKRAKDVAVMISEGAPNDPGRHCAD